MKYETLEKLISTQSFSNEIWSGLNIGKLFPSVLNKEKELEYSKLKEYSEYLMSNIFKIIKTTLIYIKKSTNGYSIYRSYYKNNYIIIININTNQIELKRSI